MSEFKTKTGQSGRIVIPGEYRRRLGLRSGDEIVMRLDDEGLRPRNGLGGRVEVQALVRRYVPEGRSLSDELISKGRSRP
ncbi:MAG: hypothetical protein AVDCRST_MAG12-3055 [uncultured Rubrobacteraceae bacterium]|uniref:SpoVT-AbrB domain-containing protein n=1 Tax=uncultured Rubrobacteraceae bacterium TaxID=349277 RepID=A0A6J4SX53_9ACTN|nr:MAG: hypothetical protein AVDCRST_MAG12-3055 [uncultured Rubrobacteraceae bacterium]